ncbi:MAG: OadG family protein [Lachnospiraceae bacterium]|nr:OadG family protein [Lachnospiraceae bacterium]
MSLFLVAATDISYGEALGNMIVGILVVFTALLFLCGVISLFKFLGKADKSSQKAAQKAPVKTAAPVKPAEPAKPASGEEDAVIAVILAAVAQQCGPNAKVTSIQRVQ